MKSLIQFLAGGAAFSLALATAQSQIVINEFQYDDSGTDDREFVELFNSGPDAINIGGWQLRANDPTTANPSITIPANTILQPGAFWVIGQNGVPNVNQVIAATLENDNETLELYNVGNGLIDAVLYEGNKGIAFASGLPDVLSQIGQGYWGNHQGVDVGSTAPLNLTTSLGRFIDGRDSNINGRDFGMRPATPGTSNHGAGVITSYLSPNVDALPDGGVAGSLRGSFVSARAFTPGIVTPGLNPNAIPAAPGTNKALIAWDNSGGGNGVTLDTPFADGGAFTLQVYFDTENLPLSSNVAGATFRGSEETFFGIGGADAFTNLADISGAVGLSSATIGANGTTGVAWYYEKVGETGAGLGDVSEMLYLIDANDGGQSNEDNPNGLDWLVLASINLSGSASAWHHLSLSIAPDGAGSASFDDQTFSFNTIQNFTGAFAVGYRENTQEGATGTPSYLRPATFAIPEPGVAALLMVGAFAAASRRRRAVDVSR